jgi:hypothetical protein
MASYFTKEILTDNGFTTIIKLTERFDSANDRYFTAVNTANLSFANTSQTCLVTVTKVQYAAGFANGSFKLYWDSGTDPVDIVNIGKSQSGTLEGFMINSSAAPYGNINLQVYGTQANDSYTVIIHMNKEQGFANSYSGYQPPGY